MIVLRFRKAARETMKSVVRLCMLVETALVGGPRPWLNRCKESRGETGGGPCRTCVTSASSATKGMKQIQGTITTTLQASPIFFL